jgi:hypothetical protein
VNIPGTLRQDVAEQLIIWKPITAKLCRLEAVKSGEITLVDLQKMNAILGMQTDIQNQAMDDARVKDKNGTGKRK